MDEPTWLACTDPVPMLECLRDRASERKLRLFAVACCRRVWMLLRPGSRRAVEVAEGFADGLADCRELVIRYAEAEAVVASLGSSPPPPRQALVYAGLAARYAASSDAVFPAYDDGVTVAYDPLHVAREAADCAARAAAWAGRLGDDLLAARAFHCGLLRDLVGPPPFRPVNVDPAWLTPPVLAVARAAYEQRDLPRGHLDPARLAVLADALEEAGCAEPALLGHLRGPGAHARGCFALDLVLGKE